MTDEIDLKASLIDLIARAEALADAHTPESWERASVELKRQRSILPAAAADAILAEGWTPPAPVVAETPLPTSDGAEIEVAPGVSLKAADELINKIWDANPVPGLTESESNRIVNLVLAEGWRPTDDLKGTLHVDGEDGPRSMAPLAFAALSAVLDLHKPEFRYPGDPEPTCAGCATHVTFTPYEKCKTVQAVLAALEAS